MATVGLVLGATTRAPGPRVTLGTDEGVLDIALAGAGTLSAEEDTVCIGRFEDGNWIACQRQAIAGRMSQCSDCCPLEDPACVFAPKCAVDPSTCTCTQSFDVPHVVYLAWYGILPKVGLTQERRVGRRLQEQGADAWFAVASGLSRGGARNIEREVSSLHHIPEYRKAREKLAHLQRPVPWDQLEARAATLASQLAKHYPVDATLHRVAGHVTETLPARPDKVEPVGQHKGRWLGGKGGYAFYEAAPDPGRLMLGTPRIAALPIMGLVGRRVAWQGQPDPAP